MEWLHFWNAFHIMLLEIWTVLLSFFIHTYSTERGMNYWNKDKKLQSQTRKVFFSKVTFIDFKKLILSFTWKSHGWVKVRRTQHLPLPHLPLSNHAHAIMKLLMEYRFWSLKTFLKKTNSWPPHTIWVKDHVQPIEKDIVH